MGNLAKFESSKTSETKKPGLPKLACMHLTSIPTCMNYLSRFYLIQFFHSSPFSLSSLFLKEYSVSMSSSVPGIEATAAPGQES